MQTWRERLGRSGPIVMWIPAMAVYLATMAGLFLAWLGGSEPGWRSDRGTSPVAR